MQGVEFRILGLGFGAECSGFRAEVISRSDNIQSETRKSCLLMVTQKERKDGKCGFVRVMMTSTEYSHLERLK